MCAQTSEATEIEPIVLENEIPARDAGNLHARMVETLDAGSGLTVDTARATSIHVAILQLMVAADAAARKRELSFTLIAPAEGACEEAFARAGLAMPGQSKAA